MDLFTMIVAIVSIVTVAGLIEHRIKAKERGHKNINDESLDKLNRQMQQIDKRLQTLEKIVTDDKYQLDKDIRNL